MNNKSFRSPWFWMSLIALIPLVLFILYPLINILLSSFLNKDEVSGWVQVVEITEYFKVIANALILASVVTVICIFLGLSLAYIMARYRFPGKSLIVGLQLITIVLPEVISGKTWLMLLGNKGIITVF